ncbi:MAG TPA: hypothetical protein VKS82_19130 [Streptosporangiaceae bacterium]|jgi:hypothetical protein|nr:hypothetical protein [Streptosporangiaceae bacterium]
MYPTLMETVAAERVRSLRNEAVAQGRMKLVRSARRSHLTTTAARRPAAPRLIDGGSRGQAPAEPATHAAHSRRRAA